MEEMLESKAVLSGGFKLKFFGFRFDSCSTADLTLLHQHYSQGVRHYLGLGLSVQVRGPNFLFFPTSAVTVQIFVFLCGAISCQREESDGLLDLPAPRRLRPRGEAACPPNDGQHMLFLPSQVD